MFLFTIRFNGDYFSMFSLSCNGTVLQFECIKSYVCSDFSTNNKFVTLNAVGMSLFILFGYTVKMFVG